MEECSRIIRTIIEGSRRTSRYKYQPDTLPPSVPKVPQQQVTPVPVEESLTLSNFLRSLRCYPQK
jgi:hypothetical protein